MRFGIGIGLINRQKLGGGGGLADIFQEGDIGSVWGKLPYFLDTDGIDPADWGEPVAGLPDALSESVDWQQPTSTARPILGRVPRTGRRNLLTWTEEFLTLPGAWLYSNVTTQLVAGPDGSMTAVEMTQGTASATRRIRGVYSLTQPETVSGRVWFKAGTISKSTVRIWGTASVFLANVDLEAGTTTAGMLTDKGNGWFELYTGEVELDGVNVTSFDFYAGGTGTGSGDGSSSIIIWHPDIRLASLDGPYQRVTNEYDITEDGIPSIHYLHFDGTDDSISTTLPAIQGTIVIAGVNGIWMDDIDFAGGEFTVGTDTYTDGPAGLIPLLGDILVEGCFIIDRALTEDEVGQLVDYYVERGSAGLIELGPELVVNGTFDEGIDGWVGVNATIDVIDGILEVTDTASGPGAATVPQDLSAGTYLTGWDIIGPTQAQFRLKPNQDGTGAVVDGGSSYFSNSLGNRAILSPISAFASLCIQRGNPQASFATDNISLRRLIMPGETP